MQSIGKSYNVKLSVVYLDCVVRSSQYTPLAMVAHGGTQLFAALVLALPVRAGFGASVPPSTSTYLPDIDLATRWDPGRLFAKVAARHGTRRVLR